jgi:predicted nucleic acid-binding protein
LILIDTDIAVDILRDHGPALGWLRSLESELPALAGYSAMELLRGCRDKRSMARVDAFVGNVAVLWPPPATCQAALGLFHDLTLANGLGLLDSFIAAIAIEHQTPLHTFNRKHFAAVPGLILVEPYLR